MIQKYTTNSKQKVPSMCFTKFKGPIKRAERVFASSPQNRPKQVLIDAYTPLEMNSTENEQNTSIWKTVHVHV